MKGENFSIRNMTKSTLPRVPFARIKDEALGKKYTLSLVFVGPTTSKRLNKSYRDKDKPTNILSFELDNNSGEIFITPSVVKKQLKEFGRKYDNMMGFLFIHGLMHLKGFDHGSKMEKAEIKLRKKFGFE